MFFWTHYSRFWTPSGWVQAVQLWHPLGATRNRLFILQSPYSGSHLVAAIAAYHVAADEADATWTNLVGVGEGLKLP